MDFADLGRGTERMGQGLAAHGALSALVAPEGQLTYSDLAELVADVAQRLGSAPRLIVAPLEPSLDSVVGYLGALAAGHPVVVSDGNPGRLAALIERFDPDVVLRPTGGAVELDERRFRTVHTLHPDLAALLPTSGSTGVPRLVRLASANLLANAAAIASYLRLTPDDRAITSLPLHYCYGLSVLHSHLLSGGSIVLTDRSVVDACFWEEFEAHSATSLSGVPYTFELLDRAGFADRQVPTLRFVTQAGGRLAADHVRRLAAQGERDGWELFVMYGQTEATARMAYLPPSLVGRHPETIGIPIPGGSFRLEPVQDAPPGVGELVYSGPNVMLGYADTPADLGLGPTVEELRTGDLARRTPEGLYEIVGRCARFAKVCGLRLDLDELEIRLASAGLQALCVSDDEVVTIAIVDGARSEAACGLVRGVTGLPRSRVEVVVLDAFPRRPNGKPDRQALAARRSDADPAPPTNDSVRAVLRRVLGVEAVEDTDTFVSLGGDSLSYVEASIALEDIVGPLPTDWPDLPVGELVPTTRRSTPTAWIETSVVLRAMAIVLVVGTHLSLWNVLGGAHLLLAMAGYSFGRFQTTAPGRLRSIARIAVPSMAWLAFAASIDPRIGWHHVLQVNGWFGRADAHGGYWFIEALLQILLPITALLAIPGVGRVERAQPLRFAAAALGIGLLVRFDVVALPVVEPHDIRPTTSSGSSPSGGLQPRSGHPGRDSSCPSW